MLVRMLFQKISGIMAKSTTQYDETLCCCGVQEKTRNVLRKNIVAYLTHTI
jgi:hypothetical protein